jgi:uncharacterized membrane protein YbhN (UPF0104 family)
MPINWLLESYKWKILVKPITTLSIYQAFRSVIIGRSLGLVSPRSLGDYFGRLLSLETENRWQLTGAMIVSSVSQLYSALFFGIIGLGFIFQKEISEQILPLSVLSILGFVAIIIAFIYRIKILNWLHGWFEAAYNLLKLIKNYGIKILLETLGWSLLRHLVFSFQFIFTLQLLDKQINWMEIFPYVSLVFLSKTILPSFNFLSDFGVREISSVIFLGMCGVKPEIALCAGVFIWVLNILIPSLLGGILVWKK